MSLLSGAAGVLRAGRADADLRRERPAAAVLAAAGAEPVFAATGFFPRCANPQCVSGWLHLWRSRATPVFEDGWNCSAACTRARVGAALRREIEARGTAVERHRHRVPLGLAMLEQGWITAAALRGALEAQRTAGGGRLGQWLIRSRAATESMVTRALALQWNCPVLPLEHHDPEAVASFLPRLFVDALGALPLRVAAGRILYLGFAGQLDPVLALAVERMTGLRVESGLVEEPRFRAAHARMLQTHFPAVELIESRSEASLTQAMARMIERLRPAQSRLVRVHEFFWLRAWSHASTGAAAGPGEVHDLICSLRAGGNAEQGRPAWERS
jgi:hypothetical protein